MTNPSLPPGDLGRRRVVIGDARCLWRGPRAFVDLDPAIKPAHVLRVHRKLRREDAFEYFLSPHTPRRSTP